MLSWIVLIVGTSWKKKTEVKRRLEEPNTIQQPRSQSSNLDHESRRLHYDPGTYNMSKHLYSIQSTINLSRKSRIEILKNLSDYIQSRRLYCSGRDSMMDFNENPRT